MVFSTFEILDKIIQYDQSNETPLNIFLSNTQFSILQYETRNFSRTSRGTKSTFKIEPCPIKVHRMFSFWGAEEGSARETMVTNE